jgi:hypothetical protein
MVGSLRLAQSSALMSGRYSISLLITWMEWMDIQGLSDARSDLEEGIIRRNQGPQYELLLSAYWAQILRRQETAN